MTMQPQYQNDPRWEQKIMGNGSTETIGYFGCLLVCLTNVGNHFTGKSMSVGDANARFKAINGFQGPWVRAFKIDQVFPGVAYQKHLESNNLPADLNTINAALNAGSVAAVRVDNSPAPGIQGHWVVIYAQEEDDYLIWDPYKREEPGTLREQFGFAGTPAEIIQEGILFGKGKLILPEANPEADNTQPTKKSVSRKKPAATPQTENHPNENDHDAALILKPTVDGLTLRATAQIKPDNVLKHLKRTSKLAAMAPATIVNDKLGRQNEWIKVREISGQTGYVAAWFVTTAAEPAFGVQIKENEHPPAPPAATTPEIVVRSKVRAVSLRSAPQISAESLIRYLPQGTELRLRQMADKEKIGVKGSWLAVTTLQNESGYVAAWLVTAEK